MHEVAAAVGSSSLTSRAASAHLAGLDLAMLVVGPAGLAGWNTTWQHRLDNHHMQHKGRRRQRRHYRLLGFGMTVHSVGHMAAAAATAAVYVSIDHCTGHHDALLHPDDSSPPAPELAKLAFGALESVKTYNCINLVRDGAFCLFD